MKKTLFTIEFIFVLVLFVFPYFLPAFSPAEVQLIEMKVTLSGFMMFFWAVLLFIFNFSLYREKQIRLCEEKNMVCGFLALKDFRLHCYVLVAAGLIFNFCSLYRTGVLAGFKRFQLSAACFCNARRIDPLGIICLCCFNVIFF